MSHVTGTIKGEIHKYLFESVETAGSELYSEFKVKKRIYNYKVRRYPTGKVNEAGEIEYWMDAIQPRVNNEIKNLRLDSRYFLIWSENAIKDFPAVYISNASLHEHMEETGRAEELSESTEDFSADGNILLRKTDKSYEKCDMMNTFLTNTLARTIDETAVIERFYLTQSELRKKDGLYKNVDKVIKNCGGSTYSPTPNLVSSTSSKSSPLYELYRRTGEISERALFEAKGEEGGDENKYVMARIICAGLTKSSKAEDEYILFAEEMSGKMSDHFKEAHRGPYKGKWWREGLYELLFDQQTAYNELTNEIMRAIQWDTSAIFASDDLQTFQNVRHGLQRGSLLKSKDLRQVQVSARITEAMNMRNAIITEMDAIANSYEVVRGITPSSGTPLGTTEMMNQNANKLFDFLRKKLAVPYRYVYREFVLPDLVKNLKGKDIIRLTGSDQILEDFRRLSAEIWFNNNLALIGPHSRDMREGLIQEKMVDLQKNDPIIKNSKKIWKEVLPRLFVTIVGESYNTSEVDTIMQTIQLEQDPARRAYFLDFIYKSKGIKTPPPVTEQAAQQVPEQRQQRQEGGQQRQEGGQQQQPVEQEPEPEATPV